MTAASDKALAGLHNQLARSMTQSLLSNEVAAALLLEFKDAELPHKVIKFIENSAVANPALMSAISKFLKDNEITCQVEESEELSALAKNLRSKPKRVSDIDTIDETIN